MDITPLSGRESGRSEASPRLESGIHAFQGGGAPLPEPVRNFLEPRFGYDFGLVRVHADARAAEAAEAVQARAFTVGQTLVFGRNHYEPQSQRGLSLIAHELTHVIQQSGTNRPVMQRDLNDRQRERLAACMAQTTEILPPRVGALVWIDRDLQLQEILGPEYPPLRDQIRSSTEARAFVCEAGVPAVVALWDTRTTQRTLDVSAARGALQSQRERYTRYVMPRRRQEHRIAEARSGVEAAGNWAQRETRSRGLASTFLLPLLPVPLRTGLRQAVTQVQASLQPVESSIGQFAGLDAGLGQAVNHLNEARRVLPREYGTTQARATLLQARENVDEIIQTVQGMQGRVDVDQFVRDANTLRSEVNGLFESGDSLTQDAIETVRDHARALRTRMSNAGRELALWPDSARRVLFVLRYLLALNDPASPDVPTAAETAAMRNRLGQASEDLRRIFGGGMINPSLDFIAEAAARINFQIDVRSGMEQRLGHATALVPSQADVQEYFRSLRREPNDAVRRAYESFAGAFFTHRVVANITDLHAASIDDLFAQAPGAVGVRGLVCSGYALMGARLLELAGARLEQFIIGVRAGDAQLRNNMQLDDAHALARLSRGGARFFVSNHLTVDREQDGIGPGAVAWTHRDNPLYIGRGATLPAAVQSSQRRLELRIRQLGNNP